MLHEAFVDQVRATITPSRVVIARITDTLTQKHDKPHAFGTCVIGRSPTCELVLSDPACSRLHCIIYFSNGHLTIRDLDSRVGTVVNGEQLANFRDFPLSKSDTIAVAGERFIIVDVDEKEIKQPLPASAVLTETAIECPFCGGQAYSFSEALAQLENHVKSVLDKDEQLQRQFLDQRDKMALIEAELDRIYKLHSEHYSNVLRGERQLKDDAEKRQAELEQAKEEEQQEAEELRMSQLSEHEIEKSSPVKEKKVTISDKEEIIEKKSVFKSFISLFKSKKPEEPETKSVKEHKPTPFVKDLEYEEEEEEEQVEEQLSEHEMPDCKQEQEEAAEESIEAHEEQQEEQETDGQNEQTADADSPAQGAELDADKPPSYHFEGENGTKPE